jgi:hypothetical protein
MWSSVSLFWCGCLCKALLECCLVVCSLFAPTKQTKLFIPKVGIASFIVNEKKEAGGGGNLPPFRYVRALFYFNILPTPLSVSSKHFISFFAKYRTLLIGKGNFLCVCELNIMLRRRKWEWRCSYIHSFITFATGWTWLINLVLKHRREPAVAVREQRDVWVSIWSGHHIEEENHVSAGNPTSIFRSPILMTEVWIFSSVVLILESYVRTEGLNLNYL